MAEFKLTPISASDKLGASFIPSPTIITLKPLFLSSLILFDLSLGDTFAITSLIPILLAIISAVISLSPVSIIILLSIFFNLFITSLALSLIISFTPISPITFLSSIT